jgi:dipeptidyl aminopeptidase/acylaminoacyl peptidase
MVGFRILIVAALLSALFVGATHRARADSSPLTLAAMLGYPFQSDLAAAPRGDTIAWVRNVRGVRNVWMARGPDFTPRQVTHFEGDDGQELTQLTFSPDGAHLVWVRGGDHDANWPAEGGLAPDPASTVESPTVTIWSASAPAWTPTKVADGDGPAISARGVLAFVRDRQVWTAPIGGKGATERLFFDRGHDEQLAWSPGGDRLVFVSERGDHAFVGVFTAKDRPLIWLAPSTSKDESPRWSPDGGRIAFTRRPGDGGAPEPLLTETPEPWSIWAADAATGASAAVWRSPATLEGSYPQVEGGANLAWAAGDRLVFLEEIDNWPHLYSVAASGGEPVLLTPGPFMVEHVAQSRDRRFMIVDANTGSAADDAERRHVFKVPVDRAAPVAVTGGEGLEWAPVMADEAHVAFIAAGPKSPPQIALASLDGAPRRELSAGPPTDFPADRLVVPRAVNFAAPDGLAIHGEIFEPSGGASAKPAVVFVHGGPPRQMLLGWHYMDYYSNAYAVNQYLADHGFVVLALNYRLGIGYGRNFNHPAHAGPAGAVEYQDVLTAGRYLQGLPEVDPKKIGIWGGSYGGYLTAMALARNSDTFKAGVDLHGVHDWSAFLAKAMGAAPDRFEKGDREAAMATAWRSSPEFDLSRWTSPVLLIQGDDDRNVPFHQTIDLARRLEARGARFEELVIPNEVHGFLRYRSWLEADTATVRFLERELAASP